MNPFNTTVSSTRQSGTRPAKNATQTRPATSPVQVNPADTPALQPGPNLASPFIGEPVAIHRDNNPFVDANGNFSLPGAVPPPQGTVDPRNDASAANPVDMPSPAPHPAQQAAADTLKKAEAERQAKEALDNVVFFQSMQNRLAALCKEHGLDDKDMAPLSNLFKDAAVTSMNIMAKASEAATGHQFNVDDPMFVSAMKLSHAANPLEGDGSKAEGGHVTFDPQSNPAPKPASGEEIDHSLRLLPKNDQPGVGNAVKKAKHVLKQGSGAAPRRERTTDTAELRRRFKEETASLEKEEEPVTKDTPGKDPAVGETKKRLEDNVALLKAANDPIEKNAARKNGASAATRALEDQSPVFEDVHMPNPFKAVKRLFQPKKVQYIGGEGSPKAKRVSNDNPRLDAGVSAKQRLDEDVARLKAINDAQDKKFAKQDEEFAAMQADLHRTQQETLNQHKKNVQRMNDTFPGYPNP